MLHYAGLALLITAGCTPSETVDTDVADDTDVVDTGEPTRLRVAALTQGTRTVEIWSSEALHVGLNTLDYRVLDPAPVDGLTVTQAPLMVMMDKSHACPYTAPVAAGDGWYTSEVVFQMAGAWTDAVTLTDGAAETFAFPALDVAETGLAQMVMAGMATWVVTVDFAEAPTVGENPFTLTVHSKQDMLHFPEVPGLVVTVTPFMPSMGHGAEGSVDPVYAADGRYEGAAAFSMPGDWELSFSLDDGGGAPVLVTFPVTL